MKIQRKINISMIVLSLLSVFLLYVRITDYYQLTNKWVEHYDDHLKNYILVLWILAAILILVDVVLVYLWQKDISKGIWFGYGSLVLVFVGCLFQFNQAPNYKSYHITPYPISAMAVEKEVNSKNYKLSEQPIYFYRKTDSSYSKVRGQIRAYSLTQENDLPCIDMETLERELGKKRYNKVIKNADVKSNNALFFKYLNDDARSSRVTFNNLQKTTNLQEALRFIDKN
ncbi:hypothetical protein LL936_11730 [Levilactobacillus brevis]|nr:hypothetical protein [Levilactobacillus brevis]MBU7566879.1 hypothetical protein [Levilactobacillus brevis]MCE6013984.1 hypothetical protein [Levilactobacillus brevis]MCE6016373.1 hypothetical protein [Levilactobacillus brevis]MCE6018780.1 hypothetical protein [Levilactobacillus brevis]MCE6021225.1 hypothetical protein [Levilactobacillus brevis]